MEMDIHRVSERLEALYQCGKQPDGTHTRMVFSEEDVAARNLFAGWAQDLGMTTRVDAAGNLIARMEGANAHAPSIMMGSHLDTVPDGGRYDGAVGCVGGLEVCETMAANGYQPQHPIEVIVFTDEEGFRFGKSLMGSSAFCGQDPDISDEELDIYGEPRGSVMKSYGIDSAHVGQARRDPNSVSCFIEMHVEQGGTLDKEQIPVGIVTSIAGVDRYEVTVYGEANHAGSTAMADRKDALVAASRLISMVPEIVAENGNAFTVATVGTIKVTPHSVNVIPGTCTFSLEIRDQQDEMMKKIAGKVKELLSQICDQYGVTADFVPTASHQPAPMSPWVRSALLDSVKELGYPYKELPSGAFHDSLIMTSVFPTGMIFVPSVGGISHARGEFTREEDIQKGLQVLLNTVMTLDQKK